MKDESLGLKTKVTKTLGLVSVSYNILELVSSWSHLRWKFLGQSRLGLISLASILLSLVLVSSLSGCVVLKNNKAKIQPFYSLKDGSCLGLVAKDTETVGLVLVLPKILSQGKSRSRLVLKKMSQSSLGLVSYKKLALTISRSRSRSEFL